MSAFASTGPINSASKSDVKVAAHTTVDFSAGELSARTTKSGDKTGSVAITIELSVIAKAGDWPIRIGRLTRGQAELTNASGGIEIGTTEDTAATVDANSTKGAVRNSLPAQDNPDQSDNQVKIYARTRFDDIVIHHAAV